MDTAFAFELRVVSCSDCGAPLPLGASGGRGACDYCGSEQDYGASSRAIEREAQPLSEPERLARLRQADAGWVAPPPELQPMFVGEQLLPWKVGEGLSLWKATREVLAREASDGLAEQLFWLTKALAAHFGEVAEPLRQRALLESGLEVLPLARHRQALCAALARSACTAGDLVAAEQWLGLCDPRSSDLESDSAYRFARATLDTVRGDYARVHQVLGAASTEVPISNEHEAPSVALRANAWEQQGRTDAAVEILDHFGRHVGAFGRYQLARFIEQRRDLGLCAASYPVADGKQRERGFRSVGKSAGAPGLIFGLAALVVALTAAAGALVGWLAGFGWGFYAVAMGGLFASLFAFVGTKDLKRYRQHRRLRNIGISAAARVLFVHFMRESTMEVPLLLYRVLVLPPRGGPFEAYSLLHADAPTRERLALGALVVVRVDPDQRTHVVVELD